MDNEEKNSLLISDMFCMKINFNHLVRNVFLKTQDIVNS